MVLKILHLHWPPHAPLLAPRCRPGQVVALSGWPVVVGERGGVSEALTPQAGNQMLPPISEECFGLCFESSQPAF